jgi:hypothetical protein
LLRILQEIQPDFEEEAKAYSGLWSQGKKKEDYTVEATSLLIDNYRGGRSYLSLCFQ